MAECEHMYITCALAQMSTGSQCLLGHGFFYFKVNGQFPMTGARTALQALRREGAQLPYRPTPEYVNSIPADKTEAYPGDELMETRILALLRWNAVAMVLRAGKQAAELGRHIASYASAASLYEVGFNHFFHAPTDKNRGDLV